MSGNPLARMQANKAWDKARQAAVLAEIRQVLGFSQANELIPFDEVQRKLRLHQRNYLGLQDVPLNQIRGSVGRYRDFTMTFLPRYDKMRDRWVKVGTLAEAEGMPPIELYKVGDAYFVLDGNHRVSVARHLGAFTIQAHVWEFTTPVGLSADANLDELLIKEEYAAFLERTHLKDLRPEAEIHFTVPGRYPELEYQIALYQTVLTQIDGYEIPYDEAVTAWYDMIYTTACQICRERGVLDRFPGRTEADLFIWVWKHSQHLNERGQASLAQAADDFARQQGFLRRLWQRLTGRGDK